MSLYEENLELIMSAVELEPVEKIPFVSESQAFNVTAVGVKMSEFIDPDRYEEQIETDIQAHRLMGEVNGAMTTLVQPLRLPGLWLSEVKLAGIDLPEDELWQMRERELVTQDDYDEILEGGFRPWYQKFLKEKLGDPDGRNKNAAIYAPLADERFREEGIPCLKSGSILSPFEMFSGGRTMTNFLIDDLLGIPEKMEKVFKVVHESNMESYEQMFREKHPRGVWVGGWRGTPDMLNPEMFEKWSWNYIRDLAQLCIDYHVIPVFHCDSNWDNGLKYFREIPKKKGILMLDGKTDIFKAKEILGDTICLFGDVPAEMLAFGKAEDVYAYSEKLCREIGPRGFILSSGCDIPYNGKLENVQAMVKAATDSRNYM